MALMASDAVAATNSKLDTSSHSHTTRYRRALIGARGPVCAALKIEAPTCFWPRASRCLCAISFCLKFSSSFYWSTCCVCLAAAPLFLGRAVAAR